MFDLLEGGVKDIVVADVSRKLIGVMHRNAKALIATGNWGFNGIVVDSRDERPVSDGGKLCAACLERGEDKAFVVAKNRR